MSYVAWLRGETDGLPVQDGQYAPPPPTYTEDEVDALVAAAVGTGFIPISIIDLPLADSAEPLIRWRFTSGLTFAGGTADAEIAATGTPDLRLCKNSIDVGTIGYVGTMGTVAFTDPVYAPGDLFELYPPVAPDATLDRLSITLALA